MVDMPHFLRPAELDPDQVSLTPSSASSYSIASSNTQESLGRSPNDT